MNIQRQATCAMTLWFAMAAHGADVGVASFNMAWAGTAADFSKHVEVCSAPKVNWCDTRAKIDKGATTPTPEEAARAKACQAAFDAASGGSAAAQMVAPCNAYKVPAHALQGNGASQYADKLAGLRSTVDQLIATHTIDVIAFQEVKSKEVIQGVLGNHASAFDVCAAEHSAFQTVAFAWRKSLSQQAGRCAAAVELAIKESPKDPASLRALRPGLELNLQLASGPVTFMNVHLKSSCANLVTGGGFAGHFLTDNDSACQLLNRQVAPLENWIEKVARLSPRLILMGDFNRRLDEESKANVANNSVRTDGSDPKSPNKPGPDGRVKSKYLWQEISDGDPSLVQVPLAEVDSGCKGFIGLDHIVLSQALATQQVGPLSSQKIPVVQKPNQTIQTSDHCPRMTRFKL